VAVLSARLNVGRVNAFRLAFLGGPDTTAPTVPQNVVATASGPYTIDLTWTASTDDRGVVSGYQVWHCAGAGCTTFAHIASVQAPAYTHTGLNPQTTHRYQVRAYDPVPNISGPSATATATTAARPPQPPLTQVWLFTGGAWTDVSEYARVAGATITQALNEVVDTATVTFDGAIPYPLQGTPLVLSDQASTWMFAGPITAVRTIYQGRAANVAYECDALDWTWLLNARLVTVRYTGWTIADIFYLLITNFAPAGFTLDTTGLTVNPAIDEITYTNEMLPQAFSRACERVGVYWYVDYHKVIRLFTSAGLPSAGTIDQANCRTVAKLAQHDDGAAIVTKVHARGGGAAAASDAAPGQDTLPVVDAGWYGAGLVECGPQRIVYTGVVGASEGGSTMGTVQPPGAAPWGTFSVTPIHNDVQPGGTSNLPLGSYWVGITNLTPSGETLPRTVQVTLTGTQNAIAVAPVTKPTDPKVARFNVYATLTPGDVAGNIKGTLAASTPPGAGYDQIIAYPGMVFVNTSPRYQAPPTVNAAGETSLTTPAGSTAVAVEELQFFPASGWAEAPGGQLLRYTGRSATSGPGELNGIPASGIGAITAALRSGTIRSIPHLVGIPASGPGSIVYPIKAGDEVYIYITREDPAAIAALAAATGGDGIRIEFLTDGRLAFMELLTRADALLAMRKQPLVTVTFETRDLAVAVGKTITFNTTEPPISGTFLIQRVQLSQFPARGSIAATPPLRVVEASSRRYTFEDLVQQIKLLGRIN